jgi:hypothetical protein
MMASAWSLLRTKNHQLALVELFFLALIVDVVCFQTWHADVMPSALPVVK